jgi:hypothetical protein
MRDRLEQQEEDDAQALVEERPFQLGKYRFLASPGEHPTIPRSVEIYRGRKLILSVPNDRERNEPCRRYSHMWLTFPLMDQKCRRPTKFSPDWLDHVVGYSRRSPDPFIDVTGDGIPDVIIWAWTGNVHGGSDSLVYSLGARPRKIDALQGVQGEFVFADLDGDKKYEAIGNDFTFAYWSTSFAESPFPRIVLSMGRHGYKLSTKFMKTPPAQEADFAEMVKDCRQSATEWLDSGRAVHERAVFSLVPAVWKHMLELIYTGNSKQAWKFLDLTWPEGELCDGLEYGKKITKKEFVRAFLKQLSTSPYRSGLRKLNADDRFLCRNL